MTEGSISFEEHSLEIVKDFLHTVVVVDDEAGYTDTINDNITTTLKAPGKSVSSGDDNRILPLHRHPLNAKQLIDTFAELGMVCAVLKPDQDEDFMGKTRDASQRADIVVLDWRMGNDDGHKTTDTIKRIIQTDNDRLRLIVIYSGENLEGIFDKLKGIESSEDIDVDREMKKIAFGNVRLILLAKDQTGQNNFPKQTCNELELPLRIIVEFRYFIMGLLSNAALKSISLIRANAHRLLRHFGSELDAAFLTQRVLTIPPDESESQIGQLILDEMRSILNDEKIGEQVNMETIRSWMNYQSNISTKYRDRLRIHNNENEAREKLLELLEKGHETLIGELKLKKNEAKGNWEILLKTIYHNPDNIHKLTAVWANQIDAKTIDNKFAYQMICNRIYQETLPILKVGTIIQKVGSKKLFLCVQPLCDCVRIIGKRKFTFLRLRKSQGHFSPEILIKVKSGFSTFYVDYKPFQSDIFQFKADDIKQFVIPVKSKGDSYIFKSIDPGIDFIFMTELKSQIAHRILSKYGNEVSRLGVTEPELLRRLASG